MGFLLIDYAPYSVPITIVAAAIITMTMIVEYDNYYNYYGIDYN